MDDEKNEPMFDFKRSKVNNLSQNHTDSGTMVKSDEETEFKKITKNTRGKKREKTSHRVLLELYKIPIGIAIAVASALIIAYFNIK